MSVNLIDLVQATLSDNLVGQIGNLIGEKKENTQSALSGAIPAILGGLINKASNEGGAEGIMNLISSGGFGENSLSQLPRMLSGGNNTESIIQSGIGLLNNIFGNKISGLSSLIASNSNIQESSAASLLGMAAPVVMGILGKETKSKGLNAAGLSSLLLSQKGRIEKYAPAGLASLLGVGSLSSLGGNLLGGVSNFANQTTDTVENAGKTAGNSLRKLLPVLVLGLLVLGVLYFTGILGGKAEKTIERATEGVTGTVEQMTDGVSNVADKVVEGAENVVETVSEVFHSINLPGGEELEVEANTLNDKLFSWLSGDQTDFEEALTFDRLTFETGSSMLTQTSMKQLDGLAKLMTAFPSTQIKVVGHTDNTGSSETNETLALKRANAVKAQLVNRGIEASRVETTGAGDANPIASNETAEGREKNRRIELFVTKK